MKLCKYMAFGITTGEPFSNNRMYVCFPSGEFALHMQDVLEITFLIILLYLVSVKLKY